MVWAARLLSAATLVGAVLLIPNLLGLDRVQLTNWFGLVLGSGFLGGVVNPGDHLPPKQRLVARVFCAIMAAACFATSGFGWLAGTSYFQN